MLHSTKHFSPSCYISLLFVVIVFVFVDQNSYIIECNYCCWGIVLFYF